MFTRSFVHVCTNGQKSFNEMKFRICLILYKECGMKPRFEAVFEACLDCDCILLNTSSVHLGEVFNRTALNSSSVHLSVVFTRSFVRVCTNGQMPINELKLRICLTLYKK